MNEEGKEAQEATGLNSSTGTRGHGETEPGCPQDLHQRGEAAEAGMERDRDCR